MKGCVETLDTLGCVTGALLERHAPTSSGLRTPSESTEGLGTLRLPRGAQTLGTLKLCRQRGHRHECASSPGESR